MTSPSGQLGAQFNMGRVPSMGLGNLDSMELPDTVRPSASLASRHSRGCAQMSALRVCHSGMAPYARPWASSLMVDC